MYFAPLGFAVLCASVGVFQIYGFAMFFSGKFIQMFIYSFLLCFRILLYCVPLFILGFFIFKSDWWQVSVAIQMDIVVSGLGIWLFAVCMIKSWESFEGSKVLRWYAAGWSLLIFSITLMLILQDAT